MCDDKVGVAKRIELEKISKEIQDLVKTLDEEINVSVPKVKQLSEKLHRIVAPKS